MFEKVTFEYCRAPNRIMPNVPSASYGYERHPIASGANTGERTRHKVNCPVAHKSQSCTMWFEAP